MSKIFKKDDIKAGYLLKVRKKGTDETFNMTVVPSSSNVFVGRTEGELACCCPGAHWWPLSVFDADLVTANYRVVAIYGRTSPVYLLGNSTQDRRLLWERETVEDTEPEPKKMTVAEIAKILGHPVEIVEG